MEGKWIKMTNGNDVKRKAVHAGTDDDGSPIYVARIAHLNQLVPGKLVVRPRSIDFYFCFAGNENHIPVETTLESVWVLVDDGYVWETNGRSNGEIPTDAVIGGRNANKSALYIGRMRHEGIYTPGKIDLSTGRLYISYGFAEYWSESYFVLVKPTKITSNGRSDLLMVHPIYSITQNLLIAVSTLSTDYLQLISPIVLASKSTELTIICVNGVNKLIVNS